MEEQSRPASGAQAQGSADSKGVTQIGEPLDGHLTVWSVPDANDPRLLPPWFRRAVVMVILLVLAAQIASWAFGQLTSFWFTIFFAFFLGLAMETVSLACPDYATEESRQVIEAMVEAHGGLDRWRDAPQSGSTT